MSERKTLGVDITGVIVKNAGTDNYLQIPGALDALKELVDKHFGDDGVFLVSVGNEEKEGKTRRWFKNNHFYNLTGIKPEHVHFCRQRSDKTIICNELGITYFIDDKLENLSYLTIVPNLYLFQGRPEEMRPFLHCLDRVKQVNSWSEILQVELW